jgi:hypothetical protein
VVNAKDATRLLLHFNKAAELDIVKWISVKEAGVVLGFGEEDAECLAHALKEKGLVTIGPNNFTGMWIRITAKGIREALKEHRPWWKKFLSKESAFWGLLWMVVLWCLAQASAILVPFLLGLARQALGLK